MIWPSSQINHYFLSHRKSEITKGRPLCVFHWSGAIDNRIAQTLKLPQATVMGISYDSYSTRFANLCSFRHVVVWGLAEDRLREQHDIVAHEHEAWITAFDCTHPAIVWSGADDCLLRGWDLRTDCSSPLFSKRHGITFFPSSFHR